MLKVDNLGVGYGDLQVVWDVSFEVPSGSLVAIIGSNGAGKTTTLRALMNLLPTITGTIEFQGESIVGVPTHQIVERGLVMIPESRATFASLTVADNLDLGAYTKRSRGMRDTSLRDVYEIFPRLAERRSPACGHPQRWRAADAGDRQSPDGQAGDARSRRAIAWPCPHHRRGHVSTRSEPSESAASRC